MKSLNHAAVLQMLPDRKNDSHKGNYGRLLLLCGSEGFTGAAYLAAMGALRCGAGLVYMGVPRCIYAIEAVKLTEAIVFPVPDANGSYSKEALLTIKDRLGGMDAVLIGPGCSQSEGVYELTRTILEAYQGPVVLDADGINVLRGNIDILRRRTGVTILTPHEGEFTRIGGNLENGRYAGAVKLATDLGVIVVLKGHETLITDGNETYINHTGNPGMAVGGSGDVLAGMLVALLGQGISPLEAATAAVWLHGAAGDVCAEQLGQYGMLPTDMLNVLPRLLK